MNNFCSKLDEIISAAQPRKLIYFAFDGPAPNAKMAQQRSRRFCSRHNMRVHYKMYNLLAKEWKQYGMSVPSMPSMWDANQITPGTFFMVKVRKTVEQYIAQRIADPAWAAYRDVVWLLSDTSEPGEGEHKLIQFIKKQRMAPGYDPRLTHCLVGMDADLIQLGLSVHDPNIMIYRDDIFVSINIVREYFRQCFSGILLNPEVPLMLKNFERLLDDLLLCFCFVGNDFLPPLPQMKIASNAIGRCLAVYISVLPTIGDYLTYAGNINVEGLQVFVRALNHVLVAVQDPTRDVVSWYDKIEKQYQKDVEEHEAFGGSAEIVFWSTLRRRAEMYAWKKTAKLFTNDPVCVSVPGWQDRYYKAHWPQSLPEDSTDPEGDMSAARAMVNREYLHGLQWVQHYYHRDCPDWDWCYPYLYGPSLEAIYPEKLTPEDLSFTRPGTPLLPLQQLLIVIPREGAEKLLPSRLVRLMDTSLKSYFPEKFRSDCSNCPPRWMELAILPKINLDEIREETKVHISRLSPADQRRCERLGIRLFVHNDNLIVEEWASNETNTDSSKFFLLCGHHGLSGSIADHKTSKKTRKLPKGVHRYRFDWPEEDIQPKYLEAPPPIPKQQNLVHRKNSISPLTTDPRLNWSGMSGFRFHTWGVEIDTKGQLSVPEDESSKHQEFSEQSMKSRHRDYAPRSDDKRRRRH